MSWLFGKSSSSSSSSSVPSSTPLQQQRIKQIKSLNTYNQNVVELKRDHEYKVAFQISGSKTVTLNILLPPQFPNDKPVVHVSPFLKHPWVDDYMKVVGSPGLNSFYMHSDLGKVIQRIVKEFKKTPPQFVAVREFELPPVPAGFPTTYSNSPVIGNLINTAVTEVKETPPAYAAPHQVQPATEPTGSQEIATIIDKLDQLQMEELERISKNPDLLLEYILEMDSVRHLHDERLKLLEENELISKKSLALEPTIEDLKGDLKETFENYNDLYHGFQDRIRRQDELSQIYNVGHISTNLRISVMQAEEESEQVAEDFLQGSINLDGFLTDFLDKRKLFHLRRAKEDLIKVL